MESYVFRSSRKGDATDKPIGRMTVYNLIMKWGTKVGISKASLQPHALRATAATLALRNDADIAHVQEWLGHSDISTTRLYDRRAFDVEDSPSYKVVL
jgi:integrase/recombinase XerD